MGEIVTSVVADSSGVVVETDRSRYIAASVVLSTGPWMKEIPCAVYRQTLYWFALERPEARFTPEEMPIFLWNSASVEKGFYGFPALDGVSMKVATEQFVSTSDADDGPVEVSPAQVQDFFERFVCAGFKGLSNRCVRAATCFYTVVADHKFVIDCSAESDRVWFASACSGHGFKHSAAIGEVLAQKALAEATEIDLAPFGRNRRSLHPFR